MQQPASSTYRGSADASAQPARSATPGSFVGASFDTATSAGSSVLHASSEFVRHSNSGASDIEIEGTTPAESGLLQLDPRDGAITALIADDDTYSYTAAAYDPLAGCHYFSDGDSIYKYNYRNASFSLGELYLVDSRLCPNGESCFGEYH